MRKSVILTALVGTALLTMAGATGAQPRPPASGPPRCFSARDWQGWKATNDHTMYIRVRGHDIYRVEFANSCPNLTWPDVHLVTVFRGTDEICAPIDFDLKVSDGHGMAIGCIVSQITPLSYVEAAAIPKKLLP